MAISPGVRSLLGWCCPTGRGRTRRRLLAIRWRPPGRRRCLGRCGRSGRLPPSQGVVTCRPGSRRPTSRRLGGQWRVARRLCLRRPHPRRLRKRWAAASLRLRRRRARRRPGGPCLASRRLGRCGPTGRRPGGQWLATRSRVRRRPTLRRLGGGSTAGLRLGWIRPQRRRPAEWQFAVRRLSLCRPNRRRLKGRRRAAPHGARRLMLLPCHHNGCSWAAPRRG